MRIEFERSEALPRLAWCARAVPNSGLVTVLHGPWVETRSGWFVEGAWNGDFADGDFAGAHFLSGSGGLVDQDGLLLATPNHVFSRLFGLRTEDAQYISNSLCFLLVQAGDALDLRYPHYVRSLAQQIRDGLRCPRMTVPTRLGRRCDVYCFTNLRIDAQGGARVEPKTQSPAPTDFRSYRALLDETTGALFANAADERRTQTYRPVASISTGYDSNAVLALAAANGCREAVTFAGCVPGDPRPDDSGASVAAVYGIAAGEYSRDAFREIPGLPEAEFSAASVGSTVPMATMEAQLAGSVYLTGSAGDAVWSRDRFRAASFMRRVNRSTNLTLVGTSDAEFRLRVGYLQGPIPFVGIQHRKRIYEISRSDELRPWSVGGDYDRPIPRRIAEEAGVPRSAFGQVKLGRSHYDVYLHGLSESGRPDFEKFYAAVPQPGRLRERAFWLGGRLYWASMRLARRANRAVDRLSEAWSRLPGAPRWVGPVFGPILPIRFEAGYQPIQYAFHWGNERIRSRYAAASFADAGEPRVPDATSSEATRSARGTTADRRE